MLKYAYLDQNQWIYLAKDYWGKPHAPKHAGIAQRVLARVNAGELRLPLNTIHHIELLRAEDADRRSRLAEVFEIFSQGWYTASWPTILPAEIEQAVARTFCDTKPLRPVNVFGRGFLFGLAPAARALLSQGRTAERVALLERIAASPGATFDALTFANEPGRAQQNRNIAELDRVNTDAAEELRRIRQSDSADASRRAQYASYTLNFQDRVIPALLAVGQTPGSFLELGRERLSQFWKGVPSLDVDCELILYRDRQRQRRIQGNDARDISHLAVAIPYCDVVVTERFWTRAAEETGLASKYGTTVSSNLCLLAG